MQDRHSYQRSSQFYLLSAKSQQKQGLDRTLGDSAKEKLPLCISAEKL